MEYINTSLFLLIAMLLLTGITFKKNSYDIIHPSSLMTITMTFSVLMTVLAQDIWGLWVSVFASVIFFSSILVFNVGTWVSDYYISKDLAQSTLLLSRRLEIKNSVFYIMLALLAVCFIWNFYETYQASLQLGNKSGVSNMIRTVRLATEKGIYKGTRWLAYRNLYSDCFTYLSVYLFFHNVVGQSIVWKRKTLWQYGKYLLPLFIYIPILILSGGRMGMLLLFIYTLTIFAILYERCNHYSMAARMNIAKMTILGGIGFLVAFLLLGFFTGKVSIGGRSPLLILAHYAGLSAPALTVYLNSVFTETQYIGQSTLWDLYSKLGVLGVELPESITFLPFTDFYGINTNVYTAMRRYIADYGFVGMYGIMFLLGLVYATAYRFIKYITTKEYYIIFYAMTTLVLIFSINDDIFFSHTFNTNKLYHFIVIYLMYRFVVRKFEA